MSYLSEYNSHNIESPLLVDEVSSEEIYVGYSKTTSNPSNPIWRIKRIWKIGSVWKSGYPNGNQNYIHVWDDRFTYVYGM